MFWLALMYNVLSRAIVEPEGVASVPIISKSCIQVSALSKTSSVDPELIADIRINEQVRLHYTNQVHELAP